MPDAHPRAAARCGRPFAPPTMRSWTSPAGRPSSSWIWSMPPIISNERRSTPPTCPGACSLRRRSRCPGIDAFSERRLTAPASRTAVTDQGWRSWWPSLRGPCTGSITIAVAQPDLRRRALEARPIQVIGVGPPADRSSESPTGTAGAPGPARRSARQAPLPPSRAVLVGLSRSAVASSRVTRPCGSGTR